MQEYVFYRSKVRPVEVDGQQRVHHTYYLQWMESARFEHFDKMGISIYSLMSEGIDLVVSNIEVSYTAPLYSNDEYYVTSGIDIVSPIRITVHSKVYNKKNDELCAHAKFYGVPVDKNNKLMKRFIKDRLKPAMDGISE